MSWKYYFVSCLILMLLLSEGVSYVYGQAKTENSTPGKDVEKGNSSTQDSPKAQEKFYTGEAAQNQEKFYSEQAPKAQEKEASKQERPVQQATGAPEANERYRTPRAGESLQGYVPILGITFEMPQRDRGETMAVSLGAAIYTPKMGDDAVIPFAAFYYADTWEENRRRLRMILAGLANFIDFFEGSWNQNGVELVLGFENYTIPLPSCLVVENTDLEDSSIYWGYVRGGIGLGWRTKVAPGHFDNAFMIQFIYEPTLMYFKETGDTADNYLVPPTTYEDRLHLRIRLDAMERNLMEMRHEGWAFGVDGIRGHRYHWRDHDFNGSFKDSDTRTYYHLSGFFTVAGGPDWLDERHRFIISIYAGLSPDGDLDRYSAPKLGGGPGGDESEALSRCPIPGARFDEFVVSRYFLASLEYRFELLFFMYIHIKGIIGPIRRMQLKEGLREVEISRNEMVGSIGIAFTTGFAWDSQLYIEYVHERGLLRGKESQDGDNVMISWSKSF